MITSFTLNHYQEFNSLCIQRWHFDKMFCRVYTVKALRKQNEINQTYHAVMTRDTVKPFNPTICVGLMSIHDSGPGRVNL